MIFIITRLLNLSPLAIRPKTYVQHVTSHQLKYFISRILSQKPVFENWYGILKLSDNTLCICPLFYEMIMGLERNFEIVHLYIKQYAFV